MTVEDVAPYDGDVIEYPADRVEYDAETVGVIEAHEGGPVDVDDVPIGTTWGEITKHKPGDRPPIIPAWLRSKEQRGQTLRRMAGDVGYYVGLHAWHTPEYLAKTVFYAPRGVARTVGRLVGWASADADGNWKLRQHAANNNDARTYIDLNRERAKTAGARWWLVAIIGVPSLIALLTVIGLGVVSTAGWYAVGSALAVVFARVGRPIDKPILLRVTHGRRFTRLTGEMVRDALVALSLTGLKNPGDLEFEHPGIHRDGPGWLARVNLPGALTAVKVIDKRAELSAAMRLPVDQIWPSAGPAHAGQLDLWVSYIPVSQMGQPRWALADVAARTSVFEQQPFGTDERQRPVCCTLFERNFLIGGQPGSGKTYGARTLATIALLDPLCEVKIAEFKGVGDFLDVAHLCSTYAVGIDDEALQTGSDIITWALAECGRRSKLIKAAKLRGEAPLGKITPELAARPGSGLHPVFILLDEVHELFLFDPDCADKAERAIRMGRALGIIFVLATQIPDKKAVPPNITRCVSIRWCLSVGGWQENDMILGTGAYKRGLAATAYRPGPPPEGDSGWGIVVGLAKPGPVRSYFPTAEATAAIVARATELRGGVVGADVERLKARDMLADARSCFRRGETGLHWATLAARLTELDPDVYVGLTGDMVRESLARYDVASVVVNVKGERLRGAKLAAIETAHQGQIGGSGEGPLPVTE